MSTQSAEPVVVVATVKPLPGKHAEVSAAFRAAVASVQSEPGCVLYALHESDDRLVMIERWESAEALTVRNGSPALATLGAALAGTLAEPVDVVTLPALPVGDAVKGRVRRRQSAHLPPDRLDR